MNKLLKVLAAGALCATALVGCGSSSKYEKMGLGIVTSDPSEEGQVNTTFAVVGLDGKGAIQYCYVDVAQSTPGADDAKTTSKKDLKEDYGMKTLSSQIGIGKEWYEQAAGFEEAVIGKTGDEVAAIETEKRDEEHNAVPKAGTDLASSCSINIGDFKEAVAAAVKNAQEVEAEDIKVGYVMSADKTKNQLNTTIAAEAVDKDGKIVLSTIDVAQITGEKGTDTRTKLEKKDDYGMKTLSSQIGIGKEWYEQIAALDEALVGKTAADVAAIETEEKDEEHNAVPKAGTDLAAGCSINIGDFKEAIAKAFK